MLFGMVMWQRQISMALQVFDNKKQLVSFIITACFLSANWTVYLYAVQSSHVASAALGYFIYPIFTVLLGIIMLRERLGRWAWLANLFFWRRCNVCFSGHVCWCANGGTLILLHLSNQLLSITTANLLFHSHPTTPFLLAVFLFGEAFAAHDLLAFGPIWFGIAIYFVTLPKSRRPVLTTG